MVPESADPFKPGIVDDATHLRMILSMLGVLFVWTICYGATIELILRVAIEPPNSGAAIAMPSTTTPPPDWPCTKTSPTSHLINREFQEFLVVIWTYITISTGLGSEIAVGWFVLRHLPVDHSLMDHLWFLAQFAFPLMMLISVQCAVQQNILAIPFLIMGLWKCGFPETFMYLGLAAQCKKFTAGWFCCVCNAMGTFSHHSSAALFICTLTGGLSPLTRYVAAGVMPTIVQHLAVPLRYVSLPAYGIIELLLEIWFEWEVFSVFETMYGPHGLPISATMPYQDTDPLLRRATLGMLGAHWLYWIGSALEPFRQTDTKSGHRGTIVTMHDALVVETELIHRLHSSQIVDRE